MCYMIIRIVHRKHSKEEKTRKESHLGTCNKPISIESINRVVQKAGLFLRVNNFQQG